MKKWLVALALIAKGALSFSHADLVIPTIYVYDEGTFVVRAASMNFKGTGVAVTKDGRGALVTINGGGGGGGGSSPLDILFNNGSDNFVSTFSLNIPPDLGAMTFDTSSGTANFFSLTKTTRTWYATQFFVTMQASGSVMLGSAAIAGTVTSTSGFVGDGSKLYNIDVAAQKFIIFSTNVAPSIFISSALRAIDAGLLGSGIKVDSMTFFGSVTSTTGFIGDGLGLYNINVTAQKFIIFSTNVANSVFISSGLRVIDSGLIGSGIKVDSMTWFGTLTSTSEGRFGSATIGTATIQGQITASSMTLTYSTVTLGVFTWIFPSTGCSQGQKVGIESISGNIITIGCGGDTSGSGATTIVTGQEHIDFSTNARTTSNLDMRGFSIDNASGISVQNGFAPIIKSTMDQLSIILGVALPNAVTAQFNLSSTTLNNLATSSITASCIITATSGIKGTANTLFQTNGGSLTVNGVYISSVNSQLIQFSGWNSVGISSNVINVPTSTLHNLYVFAVDASSPSNGMTTRAWIPSGRSKFRDPIMRIFDVVGASTTGNLVTYDVSNEVFSVSFATYSSAVVISTLVYSNSQTVTVSASGAPGGIRSVTDQTMNGIAALVGDGDCWLSAKITAAGMAINNAFIGLVIEFFDYQ